MPRLRLRIDTRDPRPIWRQIEDELLRAIAASELAVGDPVPSVRELARELRVNPNTVAKVYQRLGEAGVLGVRRGEGTFVLNPPPPVSARDRLRGVTELARQFISRARTLGATDDELVESLENELSKPGTKARA